MMKHFRCRWWVYPKGLGIAIARINVDINGSLTLGQAYSKPKGYSNMKWFVPQGNKTGIEVPLEEFENNKINKK